MTLLLNNTFFQNEIYDNNKKKMNNTFLEKEKKGEKQKHFFNVKPKE